MPLAELLQGLALVVVEDGFEAGGGVVADLDQLEDHLAADVGDVYTDVGEDAVELVLLFGAEVEDTGEPPALDLQGEARDAAGAGELAVVVEVGAEHADHDAGEEQQGDENEGGWALQGAPPVPERRKRVSSWALGWSARRSSGASSSVT